MNIPNDVETVRQVLRDLAQVNVLDDNERGAIVDEVANRLNKSKPVNSGIRYGRKSRNKQGTDLNTDALTILDIASGKFSIVDIILGFDPDKTNDDRGKFASWDGDGKLFSPGENGYFVDVKSSIEPKPNPDSEEIIKLKRSVLALENQVATLQRIVDSCLRSGDRIALRSSGHKYLRHDWSSGIGMFDRLEANEGEFFKVTKG